MRLGNVGTSRYWAAQLDMAGLGETAWNVMIQFLFTDVGLANTIAPVCGMQLMRMWYSSLKQPSRKVLYPHESWKSLECRKHLLTMVAYTCTLPKNVMVKNCNSVAILSNTGGLNLDMDWPIKLGTNRKASNLLRSLTDSHSVAIKKAATCFFRALCSEDENNAIRIADMLSEWGYTSLGWDIVEKVAIEAPTMGVEFTSKFEWCAFYVRYYEATWYWSTGRANAYSAAEGRTEDAEMVWPDPYYPNLKGDDSLPNLYCDSIPPEWKTRHSQDPGVICSRPIWIQTVLLMVRGSNPAAMAGMLNQQQVPIECIPEPDVEMLSYASDIQSKQVCDEALTMFTHKGREKNRGINQYFSSMYSDLAITNSVDIRDSYNVLAPRMYTMEEETHGPGLTNDVDIIARRVNSGMLQYGLEQTNPLKQEQLCIGDDSSNGGSLEPINDEEDITNDDLEPWEQKMWKGSGSVFFSRQEWLKTKLKDSRDVEQLVKDKRLVLIDTMSLIGMASTQEVQESRSDIDKQYEDEEKQHRKALGFEDADLLLEEWSAVSRELYPSRSPKWSVFHGKLKNTKEQVVSWGPMKEHTARFNKARHLFERAMIEHKRKGRDKVSSWMWWGNTPASLFGSSDTWFFAQSCPFSVLEMERGIMFFSDSSDKTKKRKKKSDLMIGGLPGNVRGVESALRGFYPDPGAWDNLSPILSDGNDYSYKAKRKRGDGGPVPWYKTDRSLIFILYNMLRWVEAQTPMVCPHRVLVVPEGGEARLWVSEAVTKHSEPIRDYEAVDVWERSKQLGEEQAWYLTQQMRYIQKQMDDAVSYWRTECADELKSWSHRTKLLLGFSKKRMRTKQQREEYALLSKYLEYVTPNIETLDMEQFVHWLVHRGFMLMDSEMPTHLPMGYFNQVEDLYFDDGQEM